MSLPRLTIIPAGAGSGKTYTIQEQLGQWVTDGLVAPDRIVAVTFTEAAAAELRERIGAQLLKLGRLQDALHLDGAYISTIHGFGLRILTEFSFESGTSPQPRLLNEDEQSALIRMAVARTEHADEVTSNLALFGYVYDFIGEKTPEEMFRADLLAVVELLRSVGWRAQSAVYADQAERWIVDLYGETHDGETLSDALRKSVRALLKDFPERLSGMFPGNKSAADALHKDFSNLRRASEGDALDRDWYLWKALRELRQSKRGSALPDGYDGRADGVVAAAGALPRHPGPLTHAQRHVKALLAAGQDVLVQYAEAKRGAGLVDYADMIALARQLLRDRPDVRETLVGRVDCLVVDEFQDTNPLQFALLWELATAGVPTLVVGDLKQAIMGFQGADPRLFEALQQQNPEECQPLTRNWRSQPRLMAFINAVGTGLFGKAYVALEPKAKASVLEPLEVMTFPTKAKKHQHKVRAFALGERFKALLAENSQVTDRRTGKARSLRGSDIVVLAPTHDMLVEYAEVLRGQRLSVRLQADGWYACRAVEIARTALAYVANPADRHAALYLSVTELGSLTLEGALEQLMDGDGIAEPLLKRLDALAEGTADRTVYALVADTIAVLGLFDEVATWPDGDQARANLLRLLAEAGEFMDANREALAHGGYHGSGAQTFLAWLAEAVERKAGDRQAEPRVLDEDAIVLTTWHASKGREWPVVAVCGLDKKVAARLPDLALGYSSFEDLSRVLERARIEYAPEFAAKETNQRFVDVLQPGEIEEARRLLYVALTRPRDTLILEWPTYLANKKSKKKPEQEENETPETMTYWSLLVQSGQMALGQKALTVAGSAFPCAVLEGGTELPEDLELGANSEHAELPVIGRRAVRRGVAPENPIPDSRTASARVTDAFASEVGGNVAELRVARYGEALLPDVALGGTELGTFLHRCFEVLGARPDLVTQLPVITGVDLSAGSVAEIATAVGRFESWAKATFGGADVRREWPLLGMDPRGTVVTGIADLIVQTAEGAWIIDHKSDAVEDPLGECLGYLPQLESYAAALAGAGTRVAGVAIHWVRRGEVVMMRT